MMLPEMCASEGSLQMNGFANPHAEPNIGDFGIIETLADTMNLEARRLSLSSIPFKRVNLERVSSTSE